VNGDEIGKLLGLMALADNRKPPEDDEGRKAMITFWLSMVGDLAYPDAAEAVQAHYRDFREWIMPADIRGRVAEVRQERLRAAGPVEIPEELADSPAEALAWKQERLTAIADGRMQPRAIGGTR
jgi:hypothetical protein